METSRGVLTDGDGRLLAAVEEGAGVVPGTDAAEEGATPEEGATGIPELGGATGAPEDGTPGGGTTVVGASGGWLLKGAVAVDSTDEAGGAAGGVYEPGGVGAGLTGLVAHSVRVTVTVTGAAQAARRMLACAT